MDCKTGYEVRVCGKWVASFVGSATGLGEAMTAAETEAAKHPASMTVDGSAFDVVVTVDQVVNNGAGWTYFGEEARFPGSKAVAQ